MTSNSLTSARQDAATRIRHATFTPALAVLGLLLLADFYYIGAHVFFLVTKGTDGFWLISHDRGYAEAFQHQKLLGITVVLLLWTVWERQPRLLAWAVLFGAMWADDKFMFHEIIGYELATRAGMAAPGQEDQLVLGIVGARHVGELIAVGVMGLILLGLLLLAWRGSPSWYRRMSRRMVLVLVGLVVCGVLFDVIGVLPWVRQISWLDHLFALLEDGGEMLLMSVAAYIFFAALPGSPEARADQAEAPFGG